MKKILFLTNMFPSYKNPSYGIFVKKTYEWLCKEYDIKLVKICKTDKKLIKIFYYIRFYVQAVYYGVCGDFDCVYAHYISHCSFPVSIIKKFRKEIMVIGNIHGEDVFPKYKSCKLNRFRSNRFIKNCKYIISPSEFFKIKLCEEYLIDEARVFVSPSGGIDVNLFCPLDKNTCKDKMGLMKNRIYIGFVSRIERGKGWDIFVKAICELASINSNIYAIIVGDGSEMRKMKLCVKECGMEEHFVFFPLVSHTELVHIYNSMDIFCFPSRIEAESLGLVGLEAMACEIPSVITNCGGPSSYAVDGRNCLQINPKKVSDLVERIETLLKMENEELYSLKQNGRITAMRYDVAEVEKLFINFFNERIK